LSSELSIDANLLIAERRRRQYLRDPIDWVRNKLKCTIWSKQQEILQSIRDNRKTAVAACHGPGKSFTAATAVGWWLDTNPVGEAAAVTTAASDRQVRVVLWREIRRIKRWGKLAGRTNQKEWLIVPEPGAEEVTCAIGVKPSDYDPTAFQGIHRRKMLLVYDEACGIPGRTQDRPISLWESGMSLMSNDECRALAIGNPDDPDTEFHKICMPGSGWNVIWISAFDTPNFTGEQVPEHVAAELVGRTYVEEMRLAWARNWTWTPDGRRCVPPPGEKPEDAHPLWTSKVLGRFPKSGQFKGLIPLTWIQAAQGRKLKPEGPNQLGVDVGAGGDSSTVAHRRGPVVRIVHEDHNPNTMHTCGEVVEMMRITDAEVAKVDKIGIGAGIVDRGMELGYPFQGVNVGEQARDTERFANRRAELWWGIRQRFETGDVDLDENDQATAGELCSIRYFRNSRGQIQIESKEAALKRGVRSPNRADAVMLALGDCAPEPEPEGGLVW
jgi:hypothetical protein